MKFNIVLKIGGSIFENSKVLLDFFHSFLSKLDSKIKYFLLVGGGNSCNELREIYKLLPQSKRNESDFHWKSIMTMNENAVKVFSQLAPLIRDTPILQINDISPINFKKSGIYILQPYEHLLNTDPLEHSWRVTSDAIALYYAKILCSPICVLVKNKPFFGDNDTSTQTISSSHLISLLEKEDKFESLGKGFVDPMSPHLCRKYRIPILVLDGTNLGNVENFFSKYPKGLKKTELSDFGIVISP